MDPRDDWLDPYTNTTHPIDGEDLGPVLLQPNGRPVKREWLPTTSKSIIQIERASSSSGEGEDTDASSPIQKLWKLVTLAQQTNRFYANGSQYVDPHLPCINSTHADPHPRTDAEFFVPPEERQQQRAALNAARLGAGVPSAGCTVCSPSAPCLFELVADPLETTNLANDPSQRTRVAAMAAQLATYEVYTPALTDENLACYNCSFDPAVRWANYSGPCCVAI